MRLITLGRRSPMAHCLQISMQSRRLTRVRLALGVHVSLSILLNILLLSLIVSHLVIILLSVILLSEFLNVG